jgi:hypothetical protein
MNTSADVSKQFFYHYMFKYLILLKPLLWSVDGSLHFPARSTNKLNQAKPATFQFCRFGFFRDFNSLYFVTLKLISNKSLFKSFLTGSNYTF